MNFLKVFLVFLFLGGLILLKTDATEASQWGPNCSSAPADHRICPSGNTPAYATTCIDSVNIVGGVVQYGLTPAIGNVTVTVKAAAAQLVCSSVQCLRREDTQTITLAPNNGESNPAPYEIDTLGCSGGNCDDRLIMSIVSIDKGRYTSCTPLDTVTGQLDQNGQTISPSPLHIRCTTPAPTSTPLPPRPPPCPIPSGLIGAGGNYGDVDGDGSISNVDVTRINEHNSGRRTFTSDQIIEAADVDDSPNIQSVVADVTAFDSQKILQYLNGAISTFPVCQQPSPTPTSTPTSIPNACNVTCTRDADCTGTQYSSQNQCTVCLPDGSGNSTCQAPLTPTNIPPPPTNIPTPTNIPSPTATPTRAPTPTPSFNPAACKCDGIEYTSLFSGQSTTITSYGKVEGADVSKAQITSQEFFLVEGAETIGRIINKSSAIPATVISSTPTKVRYKSDWKFTIPQLKIGATYRIWSKINCQPKTTAFNTQSAQSASVLATETQNLSLLDRIFEFFNGLFVGGSSTVPALTPTITPFTSADTTTSDVSTPAARKQLQLETIYPLEVYQKTCSFIKFRNQLN